MKLLSTLLASALLATSAGAAMADTIIGSYGTNQGATGTTAANYTPPTSFTNTALVYIGNSPTGTGTGATYDLPTNNVWANPTGGSSWVGINPKDYPNGGHVETPNGTIYDYLTTFSATAGSYLDLTLMADDTTYVYLNGVQVVSPSSFNTSGRCVTGLPTCTMQDNVRIGNLAAANTLVFGVEQLYGNATGVDFSGTVGVTPEPSSLLLMGSGLSGMAGMFFRRRRQA